MSQLPDLPLEKVLSYLDLNDLLRARAVSREFKRKVDKFRVSSLCFSEWAPDQIEENYRLIAGKFAHNFIASSKFESFFAQFGRSVLSELAHLRLCDLDVRGKTAQLIETLNSLQKLQSLDLIRVLHLGGDFKLVLPELRSIRIDELYEDSGAKTSPKFTLTLDAPRLSEIWIGYCLEVDLKLNIVHTESVESVRTPNFGRLAVESFKNLKLLYLGFGEISDSFLSGLEQLREIHTDHDQFEQLNEQKQRYGRNELKVYFRGVCLDDPSDYPDFLDSMPYCLNFSEEVLSFMIENYPRLADQVGYYSRIVYSQMLTERPAPPKGPTHPFYSDYFMDKDDFEDLQNETSFLRTPIPSDFWCRLFALKEIELDIESKNVEQFLQFLSACPRVRSLLIRYVQPQALLAQLPFYCSPQVLKMYTWIQEEVTFLPKFKGLIRLSLGTCSLNFIRDVFKQQKLLRYFLFYYRGTKFQLELGKLKPPRLLLNGRELGPFTDLDMIAEFLFDYATPARRD